MSSSLKSSRRLRLCSPVESMWSRDLISQRVRNMPSFIGRCHVDILVPVWEAATAATMRYWRIKGVGCRIWYQSMYVSLFKRSKWWFGRDKVNLSISSGEMYISARKYIFFRIWISHYSWWRYLQLDFLLYLYNDEPDRCQTYTGQYTDPQDLSYIKIIHLLTL